MPKSNIEIILTNLQREVKARTEWAILPSFFSYMCCSVCGRTQILYLYQGLTYMKWDNTQYTPYFCPECGQIYLISRDGKKPVLVELGGF